MQMFPMYKGLVFLMLSFVAFLGILNAEVAIAKNGKAEAVVVVSEKALVSEKHAAAELASFLKEISGAEFTVQGEDSKAKHRILVGPDAAQKVLPKLDTKSLGTDGILIQTVGSDLVLTGGRTRGTLYAVYTFLEDQLECRWWTTKVSHIPKKSDISVSEIMVRYIPQMEYRIAFWAGAYDEDWSVRNKTHGQIHPTMSEKRGGSFLVNNFCHTFYFLIPPKKYFKDHPEWFSEIKGERVAKRHQLCLTNKEMQKEMIKNLLKEIEERPDIKHLWVSQNDWYGACQCAKCSAIDKANDSQCGSLLKFVNEVAIEIEKKFPEIRVCTLAYQHTAKPPTKIKARDNVTVWFCDIEANFAEPLNHKSNLWIYDNLKAWGKIAKNIYFWEYSANGWSVYTPHPIWFTLGPNIKLISQNKVKGIFAQGSGPRETAMSELKSWVQAKLLWNPNLDDKKLIAEFLNGYFGKAGPSIYKYMEVLSKEAREKEFYASYKYNHYGKFSYGPLKNTDARCLTFPAYNKAWQYMKDAEASVKDQPEILKRVQNAQIPLMNLFVRRWDALKAQAEKLKVAWPMGEDRSKVNERLVELGFSENKNI